MRRKLPYVIPAFRDGQTKLNKEKIPKRFHPRVKVKESICATDFIIPGIKESLLAPGNTTRGEYVLIGCPRCRHTIGEEIEHGGTIICQNCQLHITRYGNSLELEGDV